MKTNHNSFASTKDRGAPSKERRKASVGRFLSERQFSWRTGGEEMSLVLLFAAPHKQLVDVPSPGMLCALYHVSFTVCSIL